MCPLSSTERCSRPVPPHCWVGGAAKVPKVPITIRVRVELERRERDCQTTEAASSTKISEQANATVSTFLRSEIRRSFSNALSALCERQSAWQAISSEFAAINAAYLVFRSSHHLGQARWHSSVLGRAWLRWRQQSKRQASWHLSLSHCRRQTTVGGVCQRWPRVGQRQKAGLAWMLYILPIYKRLALGVASVLTPIFLCPSSLLPSSRLHRPAPAVCP